MARIGLHHSLGSMVVAACLAVSSQALAAGGGGGGDDRPFNPPAQRAVPRDEAAQGKAFSDRLKGQPKAKDREKDKRSDWRDGYRAAVVLVQAGHYEDAIAKFVSLEAADSPDVLNYIGYANRKLGRMETARVNYEGALALNPKHRGALEYYGEWHVEMGRIDDAKGYLEQLADEYGANCREHQDLADAIAGKTSI